MRALACLSLVLSAQGLSALRTSHVRGGLKVAATPDEAGTTGKLEALTCSACEDDAWTRTVAAGHDAGEPIKEVDVVVSLCEHDLAWLHEYIEGLRTLGAPVRNVTIYSKCGAVAPVAEPRGAWIQTVVELPNVGRCDHTYAYHIAKKFRDLADATIFIKDSYDPSSPQAHRVAQGLDAPLKVDYMWKHLQRDGVTCLYDSGASHGASVWHETQGLSQFHISGYLKVGGRNRPFNPHEAPASERQAALQQTKGFQSSVRPYGAWLKKTMGIDLAKRNLWPVCYGGNFGATRTAIHGTSKASWEQLRDSLSRGDNIEENHYAERSWLVMLSQPLTESQERKLRGAATGTCGLGETAGSCVAGQLATCDCAQLASPDSGQLMTKRLATGGIATCDTCGTCACT